MNPLQWLAPVVFGVSLAFLCTPRVEDASRMFFRFSLGVGLGFGLTSVLFFTWITLTPWPLATYFLVEGVCAALIAIALVGKVRHDVAAAGRRVGGPAERRRRVLILRWVFLALAILAGLWFASESYRHPHGDWDAWAIWNLRARFLFRAGGDWQSLYGSLPNWTHPDYPLLLPVIVVRAWSAGGVESYAVPAVVAGLFTAATLVLSASLVSAVRGEEQGYLAGLALLGTGFFVQHGASQFADIEFAFFLLSTLALFYWHDLGKDVDPGVLMLAGLTTGCALWTKNEGALFLVVIVLIRLFFAWRDPDRGRYIREAAWFWPTLIPFLILFLVFKLTIAPHNDVINPATVSSVAERLSDPSRYAKVAGEFLLRLLTFGNGIVIALAVYVYLSRRRLRFRMDRPLAAGIGAVVLVLGGYFAVYIITPHDLDWHIRTSLDRLVFQIWPAALMLVFLGLVSAPAQSPSSRAAAIS